MLTWLRAYVGARLRQDVRANDAELTDRLMAKMEVGQAKNGSDPG